eukprot:7956028-Lingulodinium_polyedra.AAC.1
MLRSTALFPSTCRLDSKQPSCRTSWPAASQRDGLLLPETPTLRIPNLGQLWRPNWLRCSIGWWCTGT